MATEGYLLDTTVASWIWDGGNPNHSAARQRLAQLGDAPVFVSAITVGEIEYGLGVSPAMDADAMPGDAPLRKRASDVRAMYPRTMKFIVDNNVGKLAVWLRALGYDAVFINPIEDSDLIERARREGRVILTKDTGILRRRVIASGEVQAVRIHGDDWREQLAQVVRELGLATQPQFTRCIECNTVLEPRTRDEARAHVPPYVHRTQTSFLACPSCGRHYWQGTHWQRMNRDLARILT